MLDSLKKYGVRATFFINSDNLAPDRTAEQQRAINADNLLRIVNEGHVLADLLRPHVPQ